MSLFGNKEKAIEIVLLESFRDTIQSLLNNKERYIEESLFLSSYEKARDAHAKLQGMEDESFLKKWCKKKNVLYAYVIELLVFFRNSKSKVEFHNKEYLKSHPFPNEPETIEKEEPSIIEEVQEKPVTLEEEVEETPISIEPEPSEEKPSKTLAKEILKDHFGYDSFRKGQEEIINSILSGKDTLAIMPTGAGKSICYQIPSLILEGVTLVISPLLSLMQDQVKALKEAGIAAAYINSSLNMNQYNKALENLSKGLYKIVYVAPERLSNERFIEAIKELDISMLTIDEAHCISQWGQDFRPDYMKIVDFIKKLKKRPILSAFTATATNNVREDIICILGLNDPFVLINGFNRENLYFEVQRIPENVKIDYVLKYISSHEDESGIIYCSTRNNVDEVYNVLLSNGISVSKYHAGMNENARKMMQDGFIYDKTNIMVATNAFGMGIDKSNVRFVIHYNMPQSIENYYQEAGRAGRDGLDSKCILLYSPRDVRINELLIGHSDNEDLSFEEIESIKERNLKKLRIMQGYCYTADCLRNYILKYFGENPLEPCGDCFNCNHNFETLDVTEESKTIINCVSELKGRYGRGVIVDVLSSSKSAKMEQIGATNLKTYGKLSSTKKTLINKIIDQLLLEEYLVSRTIHDFPVIGIGNIEELKNPETKVIIKIIEEDKLPERIVKKKNVSKGDLDSSQHRLFEVLRKLRLEIAREINMPPYIVFDDKCLIDMALKAPTNKEEMLNVSGVGEVKFEKYGERFLEAIEAFALSNK